MWRYPLRRLGPIALAAALGAAAVPLATRAPGLGALLLLGAVALLARSAAGADWRMRPSDIRRSEAERLERFLLEHGGHPRDGGAG